MSLGWVMSLKTTGLRSSTPFNDDPHVPRGFHFLLGRSKLVNSYLISLFDEIHRAENFFVAPVGEN